MCIWRLKERKIASKELATKDEDVEQILLSKIKGQIATSKKKKKDEIQKKVIARPR